MDEFELNISTIASAPRSADLLNNTDDGCGETPDPAGMSGLL